MTKIPTYHVFAWALLALTCLISGFGVQEPSAQEFGLEYFHANRTRTMDVATENITHSFEISCNGYGIQRAELLTPRDAVFLLFQNGSGATNLDVELDLDILDMNETYATEHFPSGEYTLSVQFDNDEIIPFPAFAGATYPLFPTVTFPESLATDVPVTPTITWIPPAESMGFSLEIDGLDYASSYEVRLPRDANSCTIPAGILDGGRDYILELASYGEGTQSIVRLFFKTSGTPSNKYYPFAPPGSEYAIFLSKNQEAPFSTSGHLEANFWDDFSSYAKLSVQTPNGFSFTMFSSPLVSNEFSLDYEVAIEWNADPLSAQPALNPGLGEYIYRFEDRDGTLVATREVTTPEQFPEFPNILSPPASASVPVGTPILWDFSDDSQITALGVDFDYRGVFAWDCEVDALLVKTERSWNIPPLTHFEDGNADFELSCFSIVWSGTNAFAGLVSNRELSYLLLHDPPAENWEEEYNDTQALANPISDGSTILAMISTEEDEDWFTFEGIQGEEITVEILTSNRDFLSSADCYIELWRAGDTSAFVANSESKPAMSRLELQDGKVEVIYGKMIDPSEIPWYHYSLRAASLDPGISISLPETDRYFVCVKGRFVDNPDTMGPFYRIQFLRAAKEWQMAQTRLHMPDGSIKILELFDSGDYGEVLREADFLNTFPSGDYRLEFDFPDGTTTEFRYHSVDVFPPFPNFITPTNFASVTVPLQVQWEPIQDSDYLFLMIQAVQANYSYMEVFPPSTTQVIVEGVPEHSDVYMSLTSEKFMPTDNMESGNLRRQVLRHLFFSTTDSSEMTPTPTATPTPTPIQEIVVPSTDFPTIQSAIDAAQTGMTIRVLPGTYFENIDLKNKNIILRSTNPNDPDIVARTIIDGGGNSSTVTLGLLQPPTCVFEGFTVRNGVGVAGNGGGIAAALSAATIRNNIIVDNFAASGGGIRDARGIVENNTIARNNAEYGGGLAWCTGTIRNNIIVDNKSTFGGGLYAASGTIEGNFIARNDALNAGGGAASSNGFFANNMIVNNTADSGGGLWLCNERIINNTFYGNSAKRFGGALFGCEGFILNCIFWNNRAASGQAIQDSSVPSYSCIDEQIVGGVANISKDPIFVNAGADDFHLSEFSPCIDSGSREATITHDYDGDRRPIVGTSEPRAPYTRYDIGADEFDPRPQRPDFMIQIENPNLIVQSGERPQFRINCLAVNGFREKVHFSIPDSTFTHVFSPNPAVAPGSVALLLARSVDNANDLTTAFTVQAISESGGIVRAASASLTVLGHSSLIPKLSLWASPTRVRSGGYVNVRGRLVPEEGSVAVNISVTRTNADGSVSELPAIQTTTDARGEFRYEYTPDQVGHFTFTASLARDDTVQSLPAAVEVFARTSALSLKVHPENMPVVGGTLPFSGKLAPAIAGESAKVILNVWYNPTGDFPEPDQTVEVDLVEGSYSGSLSLTAGGTAVLRARWYGNPPEVQGAESPRVAVPVIATPAPGLEQAWEFNPGVSLLIAGATSDNLSQPVRDYLANLGYFVLRQRRYNDLKIVYVNDRAEQDYTGDGNLDPIVDIIASSVAALPQAIDLAALQLGASSPLSVFIVGEKGTGDTIQMGDGTLLTASYLNSLLAGKFCATCDIRIFVEASHSGEFCQAIAAPYRTVISSAASQRACYFSGGLLSFTQLFMTQVQLGWSVGQSFQHARDYLRATLGYYGVQEPLMIPCMEYNPEMLYYGLSSDATDMLAPQIEAVFEPAVLEGTTQVDIFALATDDTGIAKVEALIRKPDGSTETLTMQLQSAGSRRYEATLDADILDQLGAYTVSIVAMDLYRNTSEPAVSQLSLIRRTDLDGDNKVGTNDLLIIISEMHNPNSLYDIVEDGYMDSKDLMEFSKDWER